MEEAVWSGRLRGVLALDLPAMPPQPWLLRRRADVAGQLCTALCGHLRRTRSMRMYFAELPTFRWADMQRQKADERASARARETAAASQLQKAGAVALVLTVLRSRSRDPVEPRSKAQQAARSESEAATVTACLTLEELARRSEALRRQAQRLRATQAISHALGVHGDSSAVVASACLALARLEDDAAPRGRRPAREAGAVEGVVRTMSEARFWGPDGDVGLPGFHLYDDEWRKGKTGHGWRRGEAPSFRVLGVACEALRTQFAAEASNFGRAAGAGLFRAVAGLLNARGAAGAVADGAAEVVVESLGQWLRECPTQLGPTTLRRAVDDGATDALSRTVQASGDKEVGRAARDVLDALLALHAKGQQGQRGEGDRAPQQQAPARRYRELCAMEGELAHDLYLSEGAILERKPKWVALVALAQLTHQRTALDLPPALDGSEERDAFELAVADFKRRARLEDRGLLPAAPARPLPAARAADLTAEGERRGQKKQRSMLGFFKRAGVKKRA